MISDGNILKLYISCFSFFILDRPFLVHPSIIFQLIMKIRINEFLDVFCSQPNCRDSTIFQALYLYTESGKVTLSPC